MTDPTPSSRDPLARPGGVAPSEGDAATDDVGADGVAVDPNAGEQPAAVSVWDWRGASTETAPEVAPPPVVTPAGERADDPLGDAAAASKAFSAAAAAEGAQPVVEPVALAEVQADAPPARSTSESRERDRDAVAAASGSGRRPALATAGIVVLWIGIAVTVVVSIVGIVLSVLSSTVVEESPDWGTVATIAVGAIVAILQGVQLLRIGRRPDGLRVTLGVLAGVGCIIGLVTGNPGAFLTLVGVVLLLLPASEAWWEAGERQQR